MCVDAVGCSRMSVDVEGCSGMSVDTVMSRYARHND